MQTPNLIKLIYAQTNLYFNLYWYTYITLVLEHKKDTKCGKILFKFILNI